MRVFLVVLVALNLLLRGAAVPCEEVARADAPAHCRRPHVHLSAGPRGHAHPHRHRHDGDHRRHGHARGHHGDAGGHAAHGFPAPGTVPHHDRDAVYLDDDGPLLATGGRTSPPRLTTDWHAVPSCCAHVPVALLRQHFRRSQPPGDGAATIRTLLPHLLRV